MIVPVILAGGSGTRLWPLSRELYPKQLLALVTDRTMLQETVDRLADLEDVGPPLVICNVHHRFMVAEQLRELGSKGTIIIEPAARNTAPAIAAGALEACAGGADPFLLVLPADHVVHDVPALHAAIVKGKKAAAAGYLVTFGIVPEGPETGYGYISKAAPLTDAPGAYGVDRFLEKPDHSLAEQLVADGALWNSGMFLFKASKFIEELDAFAPEMTAAVRQAHERKTIDLDFSRLDEAAFAASPSDSIDYAVMEKTAWAAVVPLSCGWSDVGAWSALWQHGNRDKNGNVIKGDVLVEDVHDSYLHSTHRMVAAVDIDNLVVVETADAVLIANRERSQDVKKIVNRLKTQGRGEAALHRRVYRPWGSYECVDAADRFQVKRIIVNPGAKLSLQMHHHRAEHWVVVKGTAHITNGDQTIMLSENQSTYIPIGAPHRLENPGVIPLELIEVQSGSYLGEDDIVRLDDAYGR